MPLTCTSCAAMLGDQSVEEINASCFCISLQPEAIRQALAASLGDDDLIALISERCPHLFFRSAGVSFQSTFVRNGGTSLRS
jgi:hypothetical protein